MKRERRVINACGEVSDGRLKVLMVDIKGEKIILTDGTQGYI